MRQFFLAASSTLATFTVLGAGFGTGCGTEPVPVLDTACTTNAECTPTQQCSPFSTGGDGKCHSISTGDAGPGSTLDAAGGDGGGKDEGGPTSDAGNDTGTDAGVPVPVVQLASGGSHVCALLDGSKVKCWGWNEHGQLGLGDTANRGTNQGELGDALALLNLGTGRSPKSLVAGFAHTCALLDNNKIKCWGLNQQGQLGLGDTRNRGVKPGEMGDALPYVDLGTGRTAKTVVAGPNHTCATLDNDAVKCWGNNDKGQLGLGDTLNRGDMVGTVGDALLAIDFGVGRTAKAIRGGYSHTCAILDNDKIKCWGNNSSGQLGVGDFKLRGDGPGEMGDALPYVNVGSGRSVKSLSLGADFVCSILDNDQVKCWGSGSSGELGLGAINFVGGKPSDMGDALPAVNLGTGRSSKAIFAGYRQVCALLDNDKIKCWGNNVYGQLGQGDLTSRGRAAADMGDGLLSIDLGSNRVLKQVVAGNAHYCAAMTDERVECWGQNLFGQLGLGAGDTASRGGAPNQMGDNLQSVKLTGP